MKLFTLLLLLASMNVYGVDEQTAVEACASTGQLASIVQEVRHEGDTWLEFRAKCYKNFKKDQGLLNLISVAQIVYTLPLKTTPHEVYEKTYRECMAQNLPKSKLREAEVEYEL